MKIMKGKTMRKLLKKNNSSSGPGGRALIRKIEDGEDIDTPPSPPPPIKEDKGQPFDEQRVLLVELWKLPEPEVGEELCDQHEPLYILQKPQEAERQPIAVVGNVMLLSTLTEKEATSPVSTSPTEPTTPEGPGSPPETALVPDDEQTVDDTRTLWNRFENHPFQKKLFAQCGSNENENDHIIKDWDGAVNKCKTLYDSNMEDGNKDWDSAVNKCKTLCDSNMEDGNDTVAETKSLFDATIEHDDDDDAPEETINAAAATAPTPLQPKRAVLQPGADDSFDIPPLPRLLQAVEEDRPFDEYPEDEMDQEASAFFNELEEEEDNRFLSTANSVIESVKNTVTSESVVESVKTAAETVSQAAHSTHFDGFFNHPTACTPAAADSIDAEDGSQDSPVAREPEEQAARGFDKMVEECLGSETFSKFAERIPQVFKELVTSDEGEVVQEVAVDQQQQQFQLAQS
jgi:hypothetical protein